MLHSFYTDGWFPKSGLILDQFGNLYGTTPSGGAYEDGEVFELTPGAGGVWTETLLHNFANNGTDGWGPNAGLVFDAGNLYGTTKMCIRDSITTSQTSGSVSAIPAAANPVAVGGCACTIASMSGRVR